MIGYYVFRAGKKKVDYQILFIGVALMIAPPLAPLAWQQWSIGIGLSIYAYFVWPP